MAVDTGQPAQQVTVSAAQEKMHGVVIGLLGGFDSKNRPLVIYPSNTSEKPITAKTLAECKQSDIGRQVALLFENGDSQSPLIVGLTHHPENSPAIHPLPIMEKNLTIEKDFENTSLELDGETIDLKANNKITLKCGRASITLTKAGEIILRGTYLLNRSSGVNRIKGGSVQIN